MQDPMPGAVLDATDGPHGDPATDAVEITVVMPCLNEAETLAKCIEKARCGIESTGLSGEIVIADNGSQDGSQEIARRLGARVVPVSRKGYGHALHGGILAARGRYIVMGDSDDSYDFSAIAPFIERLRAGEDLVMGNRFKGGIMPGAMPWKHKWIGNPVLTGIGRLFFQCPIGDFHCGLRAFTRQAYERFALHTTGMEYASEMVIKANLLRMNIGEVPVVLHKDGRSRPPHLRSWRDGWRHLRFMLLFSPRWLFLYPGLLLFVVGLLATIVIGFAPVRIDGVNLDIGTMLVASFLCLLGHQLIAFAFFAKVFVVSVGFHSKNTNLDRRLFRFLSLEAGLVVGVITALAGFGSLLLATLDWQQSGFGEQDPEVLMRKIIPAILVLMLGLQTVFGTFVLGVLAMGRRSSLAPEV